MALARQAQRERNEAILRGKLRAEIDRGARFLEERVQRMFPGPVGLLLNPLAGLAFRSVGREEVVRRAHRQLDALLAAAHLHGERPHAIHDGHLSAYLQHDEAWARAQRGHARFPELEALLREVYAARVEPMSALLHQGLGDTYPDLVRSVYPRREAAQRVLEREFHHADRVLALAESEPGLLHAPPLVRREVFGVLRDGYAWYKDAAHRGLDDVYRVSPPPTPPARAGFPSGPDSAENL